MDTDGNGYLDREELRNMLRKVRVTFRYAAIRVIIHSYILSCFV